MHCGSEITDGGTSTRLNDIISVIRKFAPETATYEYDNVGLMVGRLDLNVYNVLCCLDVTDDVLSEAITRNCQLIVSHHPLIFSPIKSVTSESLVGRIIHKAIKNDIAIYSAHTNLDFVAGGINEFLTKLLGFKNIVPLNPYISDSEGFGRIGDINSITISDMCKRVNSVLNDTSRIIGIPSDTTQRAVIINGAGGGDTKFIDMAIEAEANLLITSEVKHHVAVYAKENKFNIIETQHYTSERIYIPEFVKILNELFKKNNLNVNVLLSMQEANPRL